MRRFAVLWFSILLAAGALSARAQVVASATARQFSITAGGMASIFQPDFEGDWQPPYFQYPVAGASPYPLFGAGAYVDVKFSRWVQLEAEGRWLRFNQLDGIHQDNYLIGPRYPLHRIGRATVYAKGLIGYSQMSFDTAGDHGRFTDFAFGGGADIKLTKHISWRAVDAEYQYYPSWGNTTLSPYGVSTGIGYRIF
jgi:opacity protein-like surface antigen